MAWRSSLVNNPGVRQVIKLRPSGKLQQFATERPDAAVPLTSPDARRIGKLALPDHGDSYLLGIEDEMLEIAKRLEDIALKDEYFVEKKLYPNVDFYSGIILKALGIPTSMFTVIFAIGRTVGWIAHWNEMMSGAYRIGRPRQLYTGQPQRDFISLDKR